MSGRVLRFPIERTRPGRVVAPVEGCLALAPEAETGRTFAATMSRPRGSNAYDDSGRLVATADADGAEIVFEHDVAARTETVVDRMGRATVHEYDDRGNVIRTRDPLGSVTERYYDEFDNMIAERDALGSLTRHEYDEENRRTKTTDPLGSVTRFEYDQYGNVTKTTDPLGRVTENVYDANGQLLRTIDATGAVTTSEYFDNVVDGATLPGRGPLKRTTDPLGNTTSYTYNADGSMRTMTDAAGNVTSYTYDANGERLTEERSRTLSSGASENLVTRYEYDANGRAVATTSPSGAVTRVEYNALGQEAARVNELGRRTEFAYDEQGRLTTTRHPDGTTERTEYDAEGRRVASIDRAGRRTTYEYDAVGRLVRTIFPGTPQTFTRTEFDSAGRVRASFDANGNATRFEYDSAGRRIRTTDALGRAMTSNYDSAGNLLRADDALGRPTLHEYDSASREVRTIFGDSTFTRTDYDSLGRRIAATDQAGVRTLFGFDALGRMTSVTDAMGGVTRFEFDEVGNRTRQVDAEGRRTQYEFDAAGRRTKRTLPLGQIEEMSYDAAGNLTSRKDFRGQTTTFEYDLGNRMTRKVPDPSTGEAAISFTWCGCGERTSMTDAIGLTSFSYDDRGRLIERATPFGTITYEHDANGNLTRARSARSGGYDMTYRYDALNRMTEAEDARIGITKYAFDGVGNLGSVEYPNGVKHAYAYNTVNRLTSLSVERSGATLANYTYTLGATGNRLQVSEIGKSRTYTYDNLYRLTSEQISDPNLTNGGGVLTYAYDRAGNRLMRTNVGNNPALPPTTSYVVDANDRLSTDGYDNAGNTTSGDGKTFAYDFENRIVSMNGGAVRLAYDGDGNLVARTENGAATYYLVDPNNPTGFSQVIEELEGSTPSTASLKKVMTIGLDLISRRDATSGNVEYFLYDGLGSVRDVIDQAGNVTTYDYDAFGTLIRKTGTADQPYLFTGERYDAALGLYHLRARYMEPGRGRFFSQDSFEGADAEPLSLHKYAYAHGNPGNNTDPSGMWVVEEILRRILAIQSPPERGIFLYATEVSDPLLILIGVKAIHLKFVIIPSDDKEWKASTKILWRAEKRAHVISYEGAPYPPGLGNMLTTSKLLKIQFTGNQANLSFEKKEKVRIPPNVTENDMIKQLLDQFSAYRQSSAPYSFSAAFGYNSNSLVRAILDRTKISSYWWSALGAGEDAVGFDKPVPDNYFD